MLSALLLVLTPLLLVFGVYHFITWFDLFRAGAWPHWKRVGFAAVIAHFLLVTGFFVFSYLDYQANERFVPAGTNYGAYLFTHSEFRRLVSLFDTGAFVILLVLLTGMEQAGMSGTLLLPMTIGVVYVAGTLQWYFVAGGIGALLSRFWESLKTGDDDEEWF